MLPESSIFPAAIVSLLHPRSYRNVPHNIIFKYPRAFAVMLINSADPSDQPVARTGEELTAAQSNLVLNWRLHLNSRCQFLISILNFRFEVWISILLGT